MENDFSAPQENQEQPPQREQRPQIQVSQEMLDKASRALATMLDYLALDATVKAEARTSKINLVVSSDEAGRIIGRKGQSLESLQLLLNRMMQKGDQEFPKVYIDIDGYSSKGGDRRRGGRGEGDDRPCRSRGGDRDRSSDRRRRPRRDEYRPSEGRRHNDDDSEGVSDEAHDEMLRQQALDAAKELKRWGEAVTLPPMNAHDRRIIHITLQDDSEIHTESPGEGSRKSVVISLKKD